MELCHGLININPTSVILIQANSLYSYSTYIYVILIQIFHYESGIVSGVTTPDIM